MVLVEDPLISRPFENLILDGMSAESSFRTEAQVQEIMEPGSTWKLMVMIL